MKLIIAAMLIGQLGLSVVTADMQGLPLTPIDANALNNTRLFFSAQQRKIGKDGVGLQHTGIPVTTAASSNRQFSQPRSTPNSLSTFLHYTGVVHSARGVQLLLNGLPWKSGQIAIVSARLQPDTELIEVITNRGVVHRMSPGDSVEIKQ